MNVFRKRFRRARLAVYERRASLPPMTSSIRSLRTISWSGRSPSFQPTSAQRSSSRRCSDIPQMKPPGSSVPDHRRCVLAPPGRVRRCVKRSERIDDGRTRRDRARDRAVPTRVRHRGPRLRPPSTKAAHPADRNRGPRAHLDGGLDRTRRYRVTIAQRPGRSPASDLPADAPVEQRGDRRIRHYNGWSACAGSRWPRGLRREVQRLLHLDTFSQLVARR